MIIDKETQQKKFFIYVDKLDKLNVLYVNPILEIIVWDLCSKDLPLYLAKQFELHDKGQYRLLRSVIRDKSLHCPLWKDNNRLNDIPNEQFVPAVMEFLRSLSPLELDAAAKTILSHADYPALMKIILHTKINEEPVFLHELASRCQVPQERIRSALAGVNEGVRRLAAHKTKKKIEDGTEMDNPLKLLRVADYLVNIFRKYKSKACQEKIADYDNYRNECQEFFSHSDLEIPGVEKKHGLEPASLGELLKRQSAYRDRLTKDATILIYAEEAELEPFIQGLLLSKQAVRETQSTPTATIMAPMTSIKAAFSHLLKPASSRFSEDQLRELVRHFAIFADGDMWLSGYGQKVIFDVLAPILKKERRVLLLEWGTLVDIYRRMENGETEEERQNAKNAKNGIFFLQKQGIVRYVGHKNCGTDPIRSMVAVLTENADTPTCILTENTKLLEALQDSNLPLCLSIKRFSDYGLRPHKNFLDRIAAIASAFSKGEQSAKDADQRAVNESEQRDTSVQEIKSEAITTKENAQEKKRILPPQTPVGMENLPFLAPDACPNEGETVLTESGEQLTLTELKGKGGEGSVYATSRNGMAAKIYHSEQISPERYEKLLAMRHIPLNISNVCWPVSILYNYQKQFVGFLMPAASEDALEMGTSVFRLGGKNVANNLLSGWDRESLVRCCIAVSNTFSRLHKHGVLMGDVNPRNILVSKSEPSAVFFVDCDSYQIQNHNCTVGMPEYSSPEMLLRIAQNPENGYANCPRTKKDEQFSLTIILFQILMLGISPFAATGDENIADAIRGYKFYFKHENDPGYNAPPGPYPLIWSNTSKKIKEMFAAVFLGTRTYSADAWIEPMGRYLEAIRNDKFTRQLQPQKYPDYNGKYVDFICDGCEEEANMLREKFEKLGAKPKFCRSCLNSVERSKKLQEQIICDGCGKEHTATGYDLIMQEFGQKWYCTSCKTFQCADCANFFEASSWLAEKKLNKELRYIRCSSCQRRRMENMK